MFTVLRHRNFRLLWFSQLLSGSGDWLRNMALLYWVFEVTNGTQPLATAAITIATTAPALLFGVAAGALADRWDRRRTLIFSDLVRGALTALQIVAVLRGSLAMAYAIAFASSSIQQVSDPARAALIPTLVPKEELLGASTLRQATASGLMMLGAALGTGVYFALGPIISFTADAVNFMLSALVNSFLRVESEPKPAGAGAGSSFWGEIKEGLAYARGSAFVRHLLTMGLMAMVASGAMQVLDLYLVTRDLKLPQSNVAWLSTASGVAMVVGYVVVGVLAGQIKRTERMVSLGLVVAALGVLGLAVSPNLVVAIAAIVIVGLGNVILNAGFGPLIQTNVARNYMGRVVGLFQSLATASMLVSLGLAGFLAAYISARWLFGAAGVMLIFTALVAGLGLQKALAKPEGLATASD